MFGPGPMGNKLLPIDFLTIQSNPDHEMMRLPWDLQEATYGNENKLSGRFSPEITGGEKDKGTRKAMIFVANGSVAAVAIFVLKPESG